MEKCKNSTFLYILHPDSLNVSILPYVSYLFLSPGTKHTHACTHTHTPLFLNHLRVSQTWNFTPMYFNVYFLKMMTHSYLLHYNYQNQETNVDIVLLSNI